jgi:hypothetical protein
MNKNELHLIIRHDNSEIKFNVYLTDNEASAVVDFIQNAENFGNNKAKKEHDIAVEIGI